MAPSSLFFSRVPQLVVTKGPVQQVTRQAVHELLLFVLSSPSPPTFCLPLTACLPYSLLPIRYYLKSYTQKQINAFATCVHTRCPKYIISPPFNFVPVMPHATLNSTIHQDALKLRTRHDTPIARVNPNYAS